MRRHYRAGTNNSDLAYLSSSNNNRVRQRKLSRSNTVTTYHPPTGPNWKPGAEPGIDADSDSTQPHLEALKARCDITIVDFSAEDMVYIETDNDNLEDVLSEKRPQDMPCRWISVNGLSWDVIKILGKKYGLHRLAVEDLINTRSRTKVDWYSDHAFAVLTLQKLVRLHVHDDDPDCDCARGSHGKMHDPEKCSADQSEKHTSRWTNLFGGSGQDSVLPRYQDMDGRAKIDAYIEAHSTPGESDPVHPIRTLHRYEGDQNPEHTAFLERHSALSGEDLVVTVEQVAIFLMSDNTVISFFEHSGADVEEPILERLKSPATMLRRGSDASLVMQAIIDAIVDLALPVKEAYNKARKDLQIDVLTNPSLDVSKALHIFTEEIDMLQNLFKPIVNLVNSLRDHNSEPLASAALPAPTTTTQTTTTHTRRKDHHSSDTSDDKSSQRKTAKRTQTTTSTSVTITPLAHTYLGDVLDHCLTIIASLDQMDASANNLSSLMFNTIGANTNNFMMIIALVTVFYSPLTFLTGYFGMNFARFSGVQNHSDGYFWIIGAPTTVVFILLVGGSIGYTWVRDLVARLRVKRDRKDRKVKRLAQKRY